MVKEYFLRKMLEKQLKDVPETEREKLITLVTQNPEFFQKIAVAAKTKMDSGMEQMAAMQSAMLEYKDELESVTKNLA